jgi:hypothetical protein
MTQAQRIHAEGRVRRLISDRIAVEIDNLKKPVKPDLSQKVCFKLGLDHKQMEADKLSMPGYQWGQKWGFVTEASDMMLKSSSKSSDKSYREKLKRYHESVANLNMLAETLTTKAIDYVMLGDNADVLAFLQELPANIEQAVQIQVKINKVR